MNAQTTYRRQEVIQMSIRVTYETFFSTGASAVRQRTCMTRPDRAVTSAIDSLTASRLTGTKNDDHDKATITTLGNTIVII